MKFSRNLNPLKKPGKFFNYSVFDIETANWTKFLMIGVYDGKVFNYFKTIDEFFRFCVVQHNNIYFAHYGGGFDFLFLIQSALRLGIPITDMIPRGSGLLTMTLEIEGRKIIFRDSCALLPFSLKTLTETFKVESKKSKINFRQVKKVTDDLIKYNRIDCEGLYQSLQNYFSTDVIQKCGPKTTIASQSLQYLRTHLKSPIWSLGKGTDAFVRRAYAGGRVEVFKSLYKAKKPLYCYDINSLYPAVMAENDFPNAPAEMSTGYPNLTRMGFTECEVYVPKSVYIPFLWTKHEKTKKFIFPVGRFKGVWSHAELKYAIELGVRIEKSYLTQYFENGGKIFESFVNEMFEKRKTSKNDAEKVICKLMMNSVYGRMGLKRDRDGLELDDCQLNSIAHMDVKVGKKRFRFVKTAITLESFSNIAIAAYVTAYARIKMHRIMNKIPDKIYYTDTDSLFTTEKLPHSDKIGEFKLEYQTNNACFLLPKTYRTDSKIVMKGFDKKKIKKFTQSDFENALEGDLRILRIKMPAKFAKLRTAMRKGKIITMMPPNFREIRSTYDKRVMFLDKKTGNWDSKPIVLE